MGSFYATCSITRHTICDGQEMYMQFLLPSNYLSNEPTIGEVFKDSFLNVVKEKGLDEAMKTFEEATSTWGKGKELAPKGMMASNDGAYEKFVPFGPAIRGYYNDYGRIQPADDEDSQNRVKILEGLMGGLPFATIMNVAQDDRWFTLGLGKYGDSDDKTWKPEGITKDMPEWLLTLCQKLSLTYFHAAVYDELANPDFAADEKGGVMKSQYSKKWKAEYLNPIKKKLPKHLESLRTPESNGDLKTKMEKIWAGRELTDRISVFRCINRELGLIYQACMARENTSLEWFYESLNFMYSLSGMCIALDRSQYGSQDRNWFGWQRIHSTLNPKIAQNIEEYDDEDDDDA